MSAVTMAKDVVNDQAEQLIACQAMMAKITETALKHERNCGILQASVEKITADKVAAEEETVKLKEAIKQTRRQTSVLAMSNQRLHKNLMIMIEEKKSHADGYGGLYE